MTNSLCTVSATWPDLVRKLAASFLKNPVHVTVGTDDLSANRRVEQGVSGSLCQDLSHFLIFSQSWKSSMTPGKKSKPNPSLEVALCSDSAVSSSRLLSHLRSAGLKPSRNAPAPAQPMRILIFVLYKKEASRVEQTLNQKGFRVASIHGDLSQNARIAALDDFKSGKAELLVATDVAARGLDIPDVSMVINYSFPLTVEDYVHRIGRTGEFFGHCSVRYMTLFILL